MIRLLIDECFSTALVAVARECGYSVDHVSYLGLAGYQDRSLIPVIEAGDYCFVANNRLDFLRLYGRQSLHNGLIVIVPNTHRWAQIELFGRVLDALSDGLDLINHVLEIEADGRITYAPLP